MKRSIWLLFFLPLFILTGAPAYGGLINLSDLLIAGPCITPPDPNTPGVEAGFPAGCFSLQNQAPTTVLDNNGDPAPNTGVTPNGMAFSDMSSLTLTGSDGVFDIFGNPMTSYTQFATVITPTTPGITVQPDGTTFSGDLTFSWNYMTADAGSFYDPAGYILCPAAPGGFPSGQCGIYQLTSDLDALNPPDPSNPPNPPFPESGTTTVTLAPGDLFGAYVITADNLGGAGTIVFSDSIPPMSATPEPASFLLIGAGLLVLGGTRRKIRRATRKPE
jgi:hypothetical protein